MKHGAWKGLGISNSSMVVEEFAVECEDMGHRRGTLTRTLDGRPLLSKSDFRRDTGDATSMLL